MFSERSSGPSPIPAMPMAQLISLSLLLTGLLSLFLNSEILIPIRGRSLRGFFRAYRPEFLSLTMGSFFPKILLEEEYFLLFIFSL